VWDWLLRFKQQQQQQQQRPWQQMRGLISLVCAPSSKTLPLLYICAVTLPISSVLWLSGV
jgi:hypothetical protein